MKTKLILSLLVAFIAFKGISYQLAQNKRLDTLDIDFKTTSQKLKDVQAELDTAKQQNTQDTEKIKQLEEDKKKLEADLQAKIEHKQWLASLSQPERWMLEAGIPEDQWPVAYELVRRESTWNPTAVNPSSGALGLCQALPGNKMATAGDDYRTNPITQLKWCHKYALERYGTWELAWTFWQNNKWW